MSISLLIKSLLRRKIITLLLLIQIAFTLALVANSFVLAQQAQQLITQPTGLDLHNTLALQLKPTTATLRQQPALGELLGRQQRAIADLPGVISVGWSNQPPLVWGGNRVSVSIPDQQETSNRDFIPLQLSSVSGMDALSLQLLRGLWFEDTDLDTRAVVLTQSIAQELFGEEVAVGQLINHGTVIGVVGDVLLHRSSSNPYHGMFMHRSLDSVDWGYALMIKTQPGQLEQVRQQLPDLLRSIEPETYILRLNSLAEMRNELYHEERGMAILLSVLSGLMLLVSLISAYSHALFHGLQQQNEIGIKRALGANKQRILFDVFSESWLTTGLGAVLGIIASYLLHQQLATVISLPALPLWVPLATASVLLLCVTIATWYPAAIATRVSPATATKAL
ncbi:peptide ABC transporter permease [Aliidiomarina minuta]|uniref:Peptide ABC transporter permease n=1 Tax=Aliidiomarina minuta TaxID=880057 RepID=A0A432W8U8_9GAMM|nr:FtsX-like permease family protein [Aliidiomarina minuta]RUO26570.1 peptide ABC transporter permease [Aliidiomarina minuta]